VEGDSLTRIVIDGDALLFPLVEAHRTEIVEDSELVWASVSLPAIRTSVASEIHRNVAMLSDWLQGEDPSIIVAFSCPTHECFRRKILPSYKSGRSGIKPLGFSRAKAEVASRYFVVTWPALEADDILGILGTQPGYRTAIVGVDKDFDQIPCVRLNPSTGKITHPSQEEADRWHLRQTLTGDPTDGYKGAAGVGQVKAEKILAAEKPWEAVVAAFENEQEALQQARVARILQWREWNPSTKSVKLWNPAV
jgi:DNA polymerase-1